MSPSRAQNIHRGEVWLAALDPVQGAEINKTRPVIVISADGMGVLPVKLVAPCTTTELPAAAWRIPLLKSNQNGLDRDTTIDLMQIRSVSIERLSRKLGDADAETMADVAAMVAVIVDYE